MNNKGFMMAEVIVVSSIVLVTLVSMYMSYNKIFTLYNQRINYYDVSTLYELAYIRDNELDDLTLGTTKKIDGNVVYYVNKNKVKDKTVSKTGLNETFKEYLDYLSGTLDFDKKINNQTVDNLLIMEKCNGDNNCKYAYLEILND